MKRHFLLSCAVLFSLLMACSPPDSNSGEEPVDMTPVDVVDMTGDASDAALPENDMAVDSGAPDMAVDLGALDMTEKECVEGSDRAMIGEEICREGVVYVCNPRREFFSLERTCEDVPVDIQFTQISARATSEMTNVYRIKTQYTIKNMGTDTAMSLRCESQTDDEEGVSSWGDDVGFDSLTLGPGEEYVIDGNFVKGEGSGSRMGTFRARCRASNEGELAATLRNEASTMYTY